MLLITGLAPYPRLSRRQARKRRHQILQYPGNLSQTLHLPVLILAPPFQASPLGLRRALYIPDYSSLKGEKAQLKPKANHMCTMLHIWHTVQKPQS